MDVDFEELEELEDYLRSKPGRRAHNQESKPMADREKRPRLTSPIGVACFVHVFRPQAPGENAKSKEPKYKIILCWDAETFRGDEMKELKRQCIKAAEAKFGADAREKIKKGKIKMPWRPASDYGDEGYGFPFDQEGWYFANFSSTQQPGIVDRKAKPLAKENDAYSGMKARVTYAVWAYDREGNKGVTLLLNNVQKIADGERLSGRPEAEDDFNPVAGEDGTVDDDDDDLDI